MQNHRLSQVEKALHKKGETKIIRKLFVWKIQTVFAIRKHFYWSARAATCRIMVERPQPNYTGIGKHLSRPTSKRREPSSKRRGNAMSHRNAKLPLALPRQRARLRKSIRTNFSCPYGTPQATCTTSPVRERTKWQKLFSSNR